MKSKIVSHYHEDDGLTLLCKSNKYGTFWSTAIPADEDLDIANEWTGGRLAEYKCDIQILKKKYQIAYQRALGIRHAINAINSNSTDWTEEQWDMMHRFERQERIAFREADKVKKKYSNMIKYYKDYATREINEKREIRKKELK